MSTATRVPRRSGWSIPAGVLTGALVLIPWASVGAAAESIERPAESDLDPSIPAPRETLGFEVGEWHARPDQIVTYLDRLVAASPRVVVEEQGKTWEGRSQLLAIVSSPENLGRLEAIRTHHLTFSDPWRQGPGDAADRPLVVWLAYSIHGNEASGANAAMVVAHLLAAARDPAIEALLERTVVLIDPMQNPDGVSRFAHWANMHRGRALVADPEHREHRESWPSGRTNHYWFDLNRDWLPAVHPESQNRLATFHRWRPNVFGDFHEMGSDGTYFFQPGVPSRWNPMTPSRTRELTGALAEFHAAALDRAGRLFYSGETFDDFYYGKGSTYPDLHGAVGILFEQASVRGHAQKTKNGRISFPFAIENQVLTSLSTLRGADAKRGELLALQVEFARETEALVERERGAGRVCGASGDRGRVQAFAELLVNHRIEVRWPTARMQQGEHSFAPGEAVVIPHRQAQYRLIGNLFEQATEFEDTTFYDVSTWTAPLAYGLVCEVLTEKELAAVEVGEPIASEGRLHRLDEPAAYAFEWLDDRAPILLRALQQEGVVTRVASRPFSARIEGGERDFQRGTVVVPATQQEMSADRLLDLVTAGSESTGVEVWALASGLSAGGLDLGSPSMVPLVAPRPALLVGRGVSTTGAGAAWFLLDRRVGVEVTLLELERLEKADLAAYTHLIAVDGEYERVSAEAVERIGEWVRGGGTLLAWEGGAEWARAVTAEEAQGEPEEAAEKEHPSPPARPYDQYEASRAEARISGAIFQLQLDRTHPVAFGYSDDAIPVFRTTTKVFEEPDNPFEVVARYPAKPHLSGFVSKENIERIAGTPAILAAKLGDGVVVRYADAPVFRGFWIGTNRLLLDGLFFGPVVKKTSAPSTWH